MGTKDVPKTKGESMAETEKAQIGVARRERDGERMEREAVLNRQIER